MLFEIDCTQQIRVVPKLKVEHFSPPRGKKMKVFLACQIFSRSVAAGIRLYVSQGLIPDEALQTAIFVDTVNSMWDFVDSTSVSAPGEKKAITKTLIVEQLRTFDYFIAFVTSWQFLSPNDVPIRHALPSHKGWILCLHSMKALSQELIVDKKVLNFLCLRKCNQDHVENMHCQIRGYNG